MGENVEDETEGGYTVINPEDFPEGYIEALIERYGAVESTASDDFGVDQEYYNKLADKLGKGCPNPDCICKKGEAGK